MRRHPTFRATLDGLPEFESSMEELHTAVSTFVTEVDERINAYLGVIAGIRGGTV